MQVEEAEATVRSARGGAGKKKQPPDADYAKNARKKTRTQRDTGRNRDI